MHCLSIPHDIFNTCIMKDGKTGPVNSSTFFQQIEPDKIKKKSIKIFIQISIATFHGLSKFIKLFHFKLTGIG